MFSRHTREWRTTSSPGLFLSGGPIIVGCNDSDASLRAIEVAARSAPPSATLILVCGVRRSRPANTFGSGRTDALGDDAYQVTDAAVIDEMMRHARERAIAAGARAPRTVVEPGFPRDVLLHTVNRYAATGVVVGMRRDRPSGQIRRLARHLPASVDLVATDGNRHVIPDRTAARTAQRGHRYGIGWATA